ncbi:MAG: SDR family NAD(P)-dependent oxidoreductase, partial [Geminicoccales bacterium]
MDLGLAGRVAIVTGGSRGIGRACAASLLAEGAVVALVSRDAARLEAARAALVEASGGRAIAVPTELRNDDAVRAMVERTRAELGRIDILINVAGILRDRMVFNMSEQEWMDVYHVHLKGHFNTIKPASVLMRQQRYGRIVNFSSISGLRGNSGQANYGAAKAGIAGLTRVGARDLGRYGVTTNCIAPGAMTRMVAQVPESARQLRAARGIAAVPPPQAIAERTPEQVAPMTVWLCTDDAWNVNGKIFHVSGGVVALAHEE